MFATSSGTRPLEFLRVRSPACDRVDVVSMLQLLSSFGEQAVAFGFGSLLQRGLSVAGDLPEGHLEAD